MVWATISVAMDTIRTRLATHDIKPTAQRVAIANIVLRSHRHPSADEVFELVKKEHAAVSRATVYNTMNLMVDKGLCKALVITEGHVVYDPNMEPHHHLIDEESGAIFDLPLEAVSVEIADSIEGFDIQNVEVIVHGRRSANPSGA